MQFPMTDQELKTFIETGEELSPELFDKLYDYYLDEMPYGTAKARDGDPYEWIYDKLEERV